jgi:putative membrane protein
MTILAMLLVALVGLAHVGFLVLEMFYWTEPLGLRTFNLTPEFAKATKVLAANQGVYNGILAAGLFWGAISGRRDVRVFFLLSVIVAGVYGALSFKMSILFVQALPAAIALVVELMRTRRA